MAGKEGSERRPDRNLPLDVVLREEELSVALVGFQHGVAGLLASAQRGDVAYLQGVCQGDDGSALLMSPVGDEGWRLLSLVLRNCGHTPCRPREPAVIDEWLERAFGLDRTAVTVKLAVLLAALYGRTPVVDFLTDKASALGRLSADEVQSLFVLGVILATMGGHLSLLQHMHARHNLAIDTFLDDKRSSPLMYAAEQGCLEVMLWLSTQGCNVDAVDDLSSSALLYATAGAGNLEAVKWLVSQGCSLHRRNVIGNTPILCAALGGHQHVLEWLMTQGCPLDDHNNDGSTCVLWAAFKGLTISSFAN